MALKKLCCAKFPYCKLWISKGRKSNLKACCEFMHKFKTIKWTKVTITICFLPLVLAMLLFIIIILCSIDGMGAVVSNTRVCAQVGSDLLDRGGSAVDAAIGTLLCEGIALPNSGGIGGGFSALIRQGGRFNSIVATPTIPAAFDRRKTYDHSFMTGARSVGVPGELLGYWEMHQKYGLLSWKEIFEPTIKLCIDGMPITEWFAAVLRHNDLRISAVPSMSEIFPYKKVKYYRQDSKLKFPQLAKTLQKIADHGVSVFYEGEIGKAFVDDIQQNGGILTLEDLKNYKVDWNSQLPRARLLQKYKLVTTAPPTSGALVVLVLNVIKSMHPDKDKNVFWHYVVEAMKYAFGMSMTLGDLSAVLEQHELKLKTYQKMIDPDFARDIRNQIEVGTFRDNMSMLTNMDDLLGKGSVNICVLAPNGDIFVGTSTLLHQFGAYFRSKKTGIIPSNILHRVLRPNGKVRDSPVNPAIPNVHFGTPHCPAIILDDLDRPFFIVGASGGLKSVTLVVNAIIRYVIMGQSAAESIKTDGTLHHQFMPNRIEYEGSLDSSVLRYLKETGHEVVRTVSSYNNFNALTCIGHRNVKPDPQFNVRRGGSRQLVVPKHELGIILIIFVGGLSVAIIGVVLYEIFSREKRVSTNVTFG